ncbi:DUF2357 domain-containing protein [Halarsenatibacter silvermanii]|uniref:DUF2357 domain-containing protein n=1 Tax=Halarsenatibacter silvermanii TaxID=321763 RepID=A0A1G9S0P8_9FIRM|nr:DUF2357 domain-containing protein [Halarsenatibacter silvermanii]SDM29002.1 hypothetical protein SAMN04488692_1255 [Halarsenatibacter silvermanii]
MAADEKKDLLFIKTDRFKLYIQGRPYHSLLGSDYNQKATEEKSDSARASLKLDCYKGCELEKAAYFQPRQGLVSVDLSEFGEDGSREISLSPIFFEQQNYELTVKVAEDKRPVEFFHENPNLRDEITPLPDDERVLTGSLNFASDVGYSNLAIKEDDYTLLNLRLEVFPAKLDYQDDYYRLLREVNDEIYNLAFDFLQRTFQPMQLKEEDEKRPDRAEFFSILSHVMDKFKKAFHRLKKSPHHRLQKRTRVLPAGRVKNVGRESLQWLRKNPRHYDKDKGRPDKLLNIEKELNYDTFENRFVRWMIERIRERLNIFQEKHRQLYGEDDYVSQRIAEFQREFDYMLEQTFLSQVGELKRMQSLSLVLQMAPGYREVHKYYLMLKRGLDIKGELYQMSMKELSRLYEYWCFLKLERILADEYDLKRQDLVAYEFDGINFRLEKQGKAEVEFENPKTGEIFSLLYNTAQGKNVTTGQRPDNILSLSKKGKARHGKQQSEVDYKFIFDAKYRLEKNGEFGEVGENDQEEMPLGPPHDSINTMHRYRDAIIAEEQAKRGWKRPVVGAFVLFPCPEEEKFKENHKFYESIADVNVGAFPFMPGSTELVSEFLQDVIEESFFSGFERNILPPGKRQYIDEQQFEQNMLVGSLRGPEQLDFILDDDRPTFYHIPCQQIKLHEHNLEYLAVYQSRRKFDGDCGIRHYWRIPDIEVRERKEIPLGNNNSRKPYYVLKLKEKQELDESIKPLGYGLQGSHIYCNYDLFRRAEVLPDLHIKSWQGWRIWLELKRVRDDIIVMREKYGSPDHIFEGVKGFKSGDITVQLQDGEVAVKNINREEISRERYSLDEFVHNLRGVFKDAISM